MPVTSQHLIFIYVLSVIQSQDALDGTHTVAVPGCANRIPRLWRKNPSWCVCTLCVCVCTCAHTCTLCVQYVCTQVCVHVCVCTCVLCAHVMCVHVLTHVHHVYTCVLCVCMCYESCACVHMYVYVCVLAHRCMEDRGLLLAQDPVLWKVLPAQVCAPRWLRGLCLEQTNTSDPSTTGAALRPSGPHQGLSGEWLPCPPPHRCSRLWISLPCGGRF